MNNASLKKWLDVVLLIMFFFLIGGMFFPTPLHEVSGCIFILLVIVHNVFNKGFYRGIFKGDYLFRRKLNAVCILLFAVSIAALMVSGIALSQTVFPGLNISNDINWRSIHLSAAICSLVALFIHILFHAKRYVKGKVFYVASVIAFVGAVAGIFIMPYLDRWYHQVYVNREKIAQGEQVTLPGKTIAVYFSRVGNTNFSPDVDAVSGASVMKDGDDIIGNTQMLAYMVQNATGCDIAAIRTEKPYPNDYGETTKIAGTERKEGVYPRLINDLPSLAKYDTIILIYPLWWHTLPMAVESVLKEHNLEGKTIVPIVTHGGGGAGESIDAIKSSTSAKVLDCLPVYSSDIPASRQTISDFLKRVDEKLYFSHKNALIKMP